eukprot:CAMPEP_0172197476 /NCGR_PEP_ID=MMETSP1050-20130122/27489_1 /TAXON_ID=233186 /ORGANISM="Cryptomonas curvata, Strain CCAP979/52" /LENGTH=98 /DNA_ID=CAMNT_0012874063 /DNA_START=85 /DNA_END=377 /DNA_ORIENTATION=-
MLQSLKLRCKSKSRPNSSAGGRIAKDGCLGMFVLRKVAHPGGSVQNSSDSMPEATELGVLASVTATTRFAQTSPIPRPLLRVQSASISTALRLTIASA